MSRHEVSFTLQCSLGQAKMLCRQAVQSLGWRIERDVENGFVGAEAHQIAIASPVRLELVLSRPSVDATQVTLRGSNFGFGPIQSGHVRKQVLSVRERIERLLREPVPEMQAPDQSQAQAGRAVVVNGVQLPEEQVLMLERRYQAHIPGGAYWYDNVCGAWGVQGGPTLCTIEAGLNLGGPLQREASNGSTGIYINGRELHMIDVLRLQQVVPMVLPGRWWLDAFGNFGYEAGPMLGNLWAIAQSSAVCSGGGGGRTGGVLSTWDRTGVAVFSG